MAVLEAILAGDDPRYRLILEQMRRAPEIVREWPASETFRVGPTSTFDDLSFPLEVERLDSDWLRANDTRSGRPLQFRVVLGRHGFLRGLEGQTLDGGSWPHDWTIETSNLAHAAQNLLTLPPADVARTFAERTRHMLESWLGLEISGPIELVPPTTEAALSSREQKIGGRFPAAYRTFLAISDGVDTRTARILGHKDAYRIDNIHMPALVVAWDSDDRDDFVVVVSVDGQEERIYRIDVHAQDSKPIKVASDFRAYLRDVLSG